MPVSRVHLRLRAVYFIPTAAIVKNRRWFLMHQSICYLTVFSVNAVEKAHDQEIESAAAKAAYIRQLNWNVVAGFLGHFSI